MSFLRALIIFHICFQGILYAFDGPIIYQTPHLHVRQGTRLCVCPPNSSICHTCVSPEGNPFRVTQAMLLAGLYMTPHPRDILVLGLGGGSLPTALQGLLPEARIHIVELDPQMTFIAERYFGFQKNQKTTLNVQDGYQFVLNLPSQQQYDLIFLDAMDNECLPVSFRKSHFIQKIKEHLKPGGSMVLNTLPLCKNHMAEIGVYLKHFGSMGHLSVDGNHILLAQKGAMPSVDKLLENADLWEKASLFELGKDDILPKLRIHYQTQKTSQEIP